MGVEIREQYLDPYTDARILMANGVPMDIIVKSLSLTPDEIEALKKQNEGKINDN